MSNKFKIYIYIKDDLKLKTKLLIIFKIFDRLYHQNINKQKIFSEYYIYKLKNKISQI